jgi:hypothetical protein
VSARTAIRALAALTTLLVVAAAPGAALGADGTASWVSAPAIAPAPPDGTPPAPYPLPVGYVGDIEFWQPNRGLLITAGNGAVSPGLYAYDGANWHQLSTVCGGTDGRIAWAGPDEFWTISDQRPGQILPNGGKAALQDVSLCHFQNGQVVASYALPLGQPNSYSPMNAAACATASDCWFGGVLDSNGAFHLHWDGTNLTVVDGSADHEIASMAVDHGQIIESVQLDPKDSFGTEDTGHPPLLHQISPSDSNNPFHDLFPTDTQDPKCGQFCPPLPEYGVDDTGAPVAPVTLGGLALGSDGRANPVDPQLWAAAGPDSAQPPPGQGIANPVVLRYQDQNWLQVVPDMATLPEGDVPLGFQGATPAAQSVAPEPNENAAWIAVVSVTAPDNQAHADRIEVDGSTATVTDQVSLGVPQGVGPRGPASAISCPAAFDCWLATQQGWLFHLTDGTPLTQDTDPNFAGVITYRPPDAGVPPVIPDQVTPGLLPPPPQPVVPTQPGTLPPPRRQRPLVSHIGRLRLVHRTTLVLPFTLSARARVQLVARRHGRIVAKTRRAVLSPGRHTVKLRLDPRHWPTKLALNAVPVKSGGGA